MMVIRYYISYGVIYFIIYFLNYVEYISKIVLSDKILKYMMDYICDFKHKFYI